MRGLDQSSEHVQPVARSEEATTSEQSSGILPNRSSILFWFAASGLVWIALAAWALWLV